MFYLFASKTASASFSSISEYELSDHPILSTHYDLEQQRTTSHTHTHTYTQTQTKAKYGRLSLWDPGYLLLQSPHLRDLDERPCHQKQILFSSFHLISKTIKLKVNDQTWNSIHHERHKNLFQRFLISFLERGLRDGPQHKQKLLP